MAVSIIIPCYNQATYLGEAIESALKQTVPPAEVIVVDDGSSDQTADVAQAYPEVIYRRQENKGVGAARRTGFEAASGEFLIFLDSDDRLPPDAVETGLAALETAPDVAFAYGRLRRISLHGSVIGARGQPARTNYYQDLLEDNYIPTPGMVMFRRSCLARHGLFNPKLPPAEDYDLYLRIAKDAAIVSHEHFTIEHRVHPDSISHNTAIMLRTVLRVHQRQSKTARRNRDLRDSFAKGRRFWKNWYGRQLATNLRILRHQGAWPRYLLGIVTLARCAPFLLPDAMARAKVSNELEISTASGVGVSVEAVQQTPSVSGDNGPLVLIGLSPVPPHEYQHLRYLDNKLAVRIHCKNARIGTKLVFGTALFDTIFVSPQELLAYVPQAAPHQTGKIRAHLLG